MNADAPAQAPGPARRRDAPWWLTLLPAAVVYPGMLVMIAAYRPGYDFMIRKEGGVEFFAVAVLLVGVAFGVALLLRSRRQPFPARWLVPWYALVTFGAFVLAGEELSWGQHLGFWGHDDLSERWNQINDQQETNFHNLTNALDQGPTNLVVLGTLIGCVVIPLVRKARGLPEPTADHADYWFWPSRVCLPAALGVLVIPWPKRVAELFVEEGPQWLRHSEIHETYIALLMMAYLASVYFRLRGSDPAEPSTRSTAA